MRKPKFAADPGLAPAIAPLSERFAGKRIIAVTAHWREDFGAGMTQIAEGLRKVALRDDVAIIYPLHPNPNVAEVMHPALAGYDNIALINPLDYLDLAAMMEACAVMLTDSAGDPSKGPQPWHAGASHARYD